MPKTFIEIPYVENNDDKLFHVYVSLEDIAMITSVKRVYDGRVYTLEINVCGTKIKPRFPSKEEAENFYEDLKTKLGIV